MLKAFRRSTWRRSALPLFLLLGFVGLQARRADAQVTFVQVNSAVPQSPLATVSAPFTAAQTAGNLNVAIVGWNDSLAHVTSVVDTTGNVYTLAVGPTVRANFASQAIYYAKNIQAAAAGANSVTVTFDRAANYVDIRIAEYHGLDTVNPLDVVAAGQGSSATANSGSVTTTNANDLLIAGNVVASRTSNSGTNFTKRLITSPDGDILEDRIVTAVGSYNATAPLAPSSEWIMQMVAFKAAPSGPPDVQAPTAPSNLTATPASGTQINLSWTAATDNVAVTGYLIERCQGAGCTTFAQITSVTTTTFNNTGLTNGTSYSYRVRATDAANNLSPYSNTATTATPDTQAPTTPTALVATASSPTQIGLVWTGSTDNVAVTNYLVERCQGAGCTTFTQIGTSPTASFSDGALTPSTTYNYRVRATDAANNLSAYSTAAAGTTPAVPDTQAPSIPGGLGASAVSSTQINLSWAASTDNVAVTNYLIERCQGAGCTTFAQIATTTATTFNNTTGLSASTSYSYRVRATDAANNLSDYSNVATATTQAAPDTQAPTAPGSLAATAVASGTQIDLTWNASTDNVAVTNYLVERCQNAGCTTFAQIGTTTGTTFSSTSLTPATSYSFRVRATDAANNLSAYSNTATAVTPDTLAPSTPGALGATAASTTQINLSWTASTDNVAVANYLVEQCQGAGCTTFTQIGSSTGTTFNNTGLTASTSYSYRVRATDAAGNFSGYSNVATASTLTPDTQAPTAPSNLATNVVSSGQINLSWTASTDNIAVTNYLVERCQGAGCTTFAQVGTSTGTTFNNTGLTGGTSYSYRVRATDAAANMSAYSNTATATTTATPTIAFVQVNSAVPQSSVATVTVPFTQAQSAGNLNVVVVGWNDSAGTVQSVTDTKGNAYVLAVGPTVKGGFATQSIYYAANIAPAAANANTVTVTFNSAQPFPDIRIAEYTGIAPVSPVDVVAGATGSSATSATTAVTTTNANDLIIGANIVATTTTAAGSGFTSRVITSPDGDILEDRIVSAVGSYAASATIASGSWIMQMVAFKAGVATPDTQAPTAPGALTATPLSGTQINLSWVASTDNVGVTGYTVERCQTPGCTTFAQITALPGTATAYSDNSLTPSTSYSYRVRATDAAANLSAYSATGTAVTMAPDTTPPSAPGTLTATAISGTQITVTWGAATDDVGVDGYRLERCQGAGCSVFTKFGQTITGTTFTDTSLSLNTSYSYIVRAQDAAGNLGPYSNVASATTLSTNPSLVAAYSFDEGSGVTVNDISGNGNNGTVANGTWTAVGKFGKALVFNGNNSMVTIPDAPSLRLTSAMSLEAWVNPSVVNSGWKDLIYKGNDNYYLEGATPAGPPMIGITVGASATEAFGVTPLTPNVWTHLAATYDGATLRFYVNGTQIASAPRTGPIITSSNPLQIGGDSIWGQFFQGAIDEVRVYNTALTPGQIQADMATAVSGSSPAVSLSTTSVNFGNQQVGTPSTPQPITLTNGGTVTLNITSISISGLQSADFSQTNNCPAALAAFASCTINATFTPSNGGTRNASIVIANNAPGNPHAITLTGVGTGFQITPQTAVVTPTQTKQFTVTGAGGAQVVWSVDNVAGGTSATGTITQAGLYTPPNTGGQHLVTVATTDGLKSATATMYVSTVPGMYTHHNDNARTGQNLAESVLSLANVSAASFGKLASFDTDGIAHASPLYVAGVNIPGVGVRNVVYVATEHDSVYAFDSDGVGPNPLWKVSFLGTGVTSVPNGDTGECCDITPEIGITGTPAIDPATNTLYVVAKTKEGTNNYVQRLHAMDLGTGAEKFGGPVVISATVPGTGTGSTNGQLSFNALRENQRTAVLLYNGVVYFGFGSHGDNQPYHGWLMGYNATTLQRVLAFTSTPNGEGGGIWQSGGGLAIDSAGNFFFATGDGTFNKNSGGSDYGDSFLKFNPATGVVDWFTPHDEGNLNSNNLDLDAGGMILLPDQPGAHPHVMVSAGKSGSIYVVDRDNLSHFNAVDQNVQTIVNAFPFGTPLPGNYSSPVYFNGTVYFGPVSDVVQAFKVNSGSTLSLAPTSTTPEAFPYPGGALAISANGTANGILWAVQKNGAAPGALRAYDASNLAIELYNSDQAGTRDTLDTAAKFSIPLVINGRVYVASEKKFTIFGLLP